MKIINRLLDYHNTWELPHIYLFTGNSTVRNDGALVMGRGAARQVRDRYPHVAYEFGQMMKHATGNVLFVPIDSAKVLPPLQYIGWFKVKQHWREDALLYLIDQSVEELSIIAEAGKNYTFHMNYPGIGNGRLHPASVESVIERLPDNVLIYK